ncbi:Type I secretion system membrane fusion protein PrsE [Aquimixticola soesokkakensis]|uniref:Membrane fusion protein (MFP) family protein n=1 Tax=Aquimixticola soesokkakensis TaxID=1519096 RepID=A0A1Y5RHA2_9RHOB|nr:HlyD family type I secretion periplasmic adaptor subunit [Aquimixticola soesokkakensis]SLN16296.1 Type I secretion system membrane fusion protein PrsE [Aquimixticola soesokkakensis]
MTRPPHQDIGLRAPDTAPQSLASSSDWSPRGALILGWVCVALLLLGFGGWSVFSTIAGAVVASGQIEVEQNRQVVQHPYGGQVRAVLVKEGDLVQEGQPVMRLDPVGLDSQFAIADARYYEYLASEARLEAERDARRALIVPQVLADAAQARPDVQRILDGQRELLAARLVTAEQEVAQLEKRREQIQAQVVGLKAQQRALSEQLALSNAEIANQQSLFDRGLAQSSTILALRSNASEVAGALGAISAQIAQAEQQITEVDLVVLKNATDRREAAITEMRDVKSALLQAAQERASLADRLERLELRAPVSGIVYGLTVFGAGAVVRAADPVLYIVPQDRPLVIAAKVSPIHIDQVFPGQAVSVRFPAFDTRTTPEVDGTIVRISPDSFTDERTGATYYRAEIRLPQDEVAKLPEGDVLIPGMPVETYMKTSDRSPLAYLVKPFSEYFMRAFRED